MEQYQVDDYVRITDIESVHSTYSSWAEKYIKPPFQWTKKEYPKKGGIYKITAIGKSGIEHYCFKNLYGVSDESGNTYILNERGIENVTELLAVKSLVAELGIYLDFDQPLRPGEKITVKDAEKVNHLFERLKEFIEN